MSAYLAHYGVMGMKWGVRKDRGSARAYRKAAKYEKKLDESVRFRGTSRGKRYEKRHKKYLALYNKAVDKEAQEAGESKDLKRLADTLTEGRTSKNAEEYDSALRAVLSKEAGALAKKRKEFTDLYAPFREATRLSDNDVDRYARKELGRKWDNLDEKSREKNDYKSKSQYIKSWEKDKTHEWYEYAMDGYARERIGAKTGAKTDKDLWDYNAKVNASYNDYKKSCEKFVSGVLGTYGKRRLDAYSDGTYNELTNRVVYSLTDDAAYYPERQVKDKR